MATDLSNLTTEDINNLSVQQSLEGLALFREESKHPMKLNEEFLLQIIKDNKDTEIGKKYDFATITSIEEYQKRLPVTTYDDYAEYVLRMVYNDEDNLMTAYDVNLYCETNGTLGNPKIMPMSEKAIEVHSKYNTTMWTALNEISLDPIWKKGRSLFLMECKMVEMKKGKSYGALSSILIGKMKPVLEKITSTPFEALFPTGGTDTRYLQARFGLMASDITQISCTFLSYAAEIMRYIEKNWKMLVDDIETGKISDKVNIPDDVRAKLLERLKPMPERAAELRSAFEKGFDEPFTRKIWKNLVTVSGIGTGAFEIYDKKLRERYVDDKVKFFYPGISSTEALFSVPVEMDSKDSALVPQSVFYEFLPVDANDDFSKIVTMDKVDVGKDYEIIMTTLSGLYRYRMRDCVRIMGKYNELPLIRFQYRIDQMVDILDDHTTELALTKTATDTAKELSFELVDFSVFPDRDAMPPRYTYLMEVGNIPDGLTVETIRKKLNEKLCGYNPDLKSYIDKGLCAPVELHIEQDETYMLYRDLMVMKGRSSAQIKPVRIIINEFQRKFFFGLIDKEAES
jgi:hypothetical protein